MPTVHVLDASRSVGVVDRLNNPDHRPEFEAKNRAEQAELVASFEGRQQKIDLVPYAEAVAHRFATDWNAVRIDTPEFTGTRVLDDFPLEKLVDYIDWSPFFLTWELKGKYPKILNDPTVGTEAKKLFDDARNLLDEIVSKKLLTARGVYGFWPAASIGDDIVLFADESRTTERTARPHLRQQWERKGQTEFRALADYVAPVDSGRKDYLGAFAVTTGTASTSSWPSTTPNTTTTIRSWSKPWPIGWPRRSPNACTRKPGATGATAPKSGSRNDELIAEKYRGIRPAPGYPACPDHTEKGPLFQLLDAESATGIRLTESFAMTPAAAVSGWYFAHPEARYFAVDRINRDQVEDYAKRKGMPLAEIERWLAPNLGYEPTR